MGDLSQIVPPGLLAPFRHCVVYSGLRSGGNAAKLFIFTSNIDQIDLDGIFATTRAIGVWKVRQKGSAVLAWLETPFCRVRDEHAALMVSIGRPMEREPVCVVTWNPDAEHLIISRRWSGEFGALVARRPLTVVTSHLRLASVACRGVRPSMKAVAPGDPCG